MIVYPTVETLPHLDIKRQLRVSLSKISHSRESQSMSGNRNVPSWLLKDMGYQEDSESSQNVTSSSETCHNVHEEVPVLEKSFGSSYSVVE